MTKARSKGQDPLECARGLLAVRPRSTQEIRVHLTKKYGPGEAEGALAVLTMGGCLDDRAFALWWIRERLHFKPLGRGRLAQELRDKGVPGETIQEALCQELGDDDGALALEAARGLARRYHGLSPDRARRRLGDALGRRGFDAGSVARALEEVLGEDLH
ncbi:MAG: regulatory protein RecX [Bacillota bacterium]